MVNGLHFGKTEFHFKNWHNESEAQRTAERVKTPACAAAELATRNLLHKVAVIVRARRDECLTGVRSGEERATSRLLKAAVDEHGYLTRPKHKQITLISDRIVEPDPTHPPVMMLQALPPQESLYYSNESNVIEAPPSHY